MRPARTCVLLLAVLALWVAPVGAAEFRAGERLVLALYYPWYDTSTWESGMTADRPLVPYNSGDREAIVRHVDWARAAGIDALVSAWFGPRGDNPTETNFAKLLDVARARGMSAALMLETDSDAFFPDRASLVAALRRFLEVHAVHPAYLRVDGRPALFVWNPAAVHAPGGGRVNRRSAAAVAAWRSLLDEVNPARGAIWIAEGEFTGMLEVFDGLFPYSVAWSPDPARQLATYGQRVREFSARAGAHKLWIATAMPGYDDTKAPGRDRTFVVDRAGGAYYRSTFLGAIASRPDWIMLTSFNEWVEGSQIEPSPGYQTLYLDLTREFAALFKQG